MAGNSAQGRAPVAARQRQQRRQRSARAMTTVIWHHGELHTAAAPVVSGADRGFLLGHGVFTTCGLLDGRPFALTRHLRRLTDNAERIGLPAPPRDDIWGAVEIGRASCRERVEVAGVGGWLEGTRER